MYLINTRKLSSVRGEQKRRRLIEEVKCFYNIITLFEQIKATETTTTEVLDTLVLVQLQVRINNGLVFDDFNTNKFLSVRRFKRSSDTKATTNLEEMIKRKIDETTNVSLKKKEKEGRTFISVRI